MVLKLNKSLYGLCQSSSNWFKVLSSGLSDRGVKGPENFNLTNKGKMDQYSVDDTFKSRATPASTPLLSKDPDGAPWKYDWNYRSAVGMLGYLQGSTRPDISMAMRQCARFNNDPKMSHERAICTSADI
eukprot:scaffold308379_cov37-Attheya_sp.AAC.2